MGNGGVNILDNILKDSFGFKIGDNTSNNIQKNQVDNRQIYPNNNPPGSEEQIKEYKLDS